MLRTLVNTTPVLLSFLLFIPSAWSVCVNVDRANLRAKPNAKSKVTWQVGKYMPLVELGREGKWMKVQDLEGKVHWIHRSLISYGYKCAAIKSAKANLRKGPGKKFSTTPLSMAKKYFAFRKIKREEAWLKLKDDYGFVHWVHESSLWEPLVRSKVRF